MELLYFIVNPLLFSSDFESEKKRKAALCGRSGQPAGDFALWCHLVGTGEIFPWGHSAQVVSRSLRPLVLSGAGMASQQMNKWQHVKVLERPSYL